jgi:hypothetical protein
MIISPTVILHRRKDVMNILGVPPDRTSSVRRNIFTYAKVNEPEKIDDPMVAFTLGEESLDDAYPTAILSVVNAHQSLANNANPITR